MKLSSRLFKVNTCFQGSSYNYVMIGIRAEVMRSKIVTGYGKGLWDVWYVNEWVVGGVCVCV